MEKFRGGLFGGIWRDVGGGSLSDSGNIVLFIVLGQGLRGNAQEWAEAVPRTSPSSRSWYPVRGIVCQPEATKCSEGYRLSWVVIISTI